MKSNFPNHSVVRIAAAFAGLLSLHAVAVDPQADWKTLIFPTLVPKAGMGNVVPNGLNSGTIRQQYESRYEEYWKETSYFDYDHTTGAKIRGYFNDTKTYGYTQVPWAIRPPTGTSGGSMGGERFRDGWRRTYLVFNGRDNAPAGAGSSSTTDRFNNQWYFADACDADIAWTPGETFFDRDGDHKWDPAVPAEDYWNSDHFNGNTFLQRRNAGGTALGNLNVILPGGTYRPVNNTAAYFANAGELFVDFNDSNQGGAVQAGSGPGYDDAVDIVYYQGGSQRRIVNHNELDFTPFDATTINEGDAAHTVVIANDPANNTGVPPGNIARNGQFDYTSDSAGTPQVVAINRYVQYDAYVYTNSARDALGFYRYEDVWTAPAYPATPDLSTNSTRDNVGIRKVRAFIYQTRELYSNFKGANEYGDEPGNPIPPRTVSVDNQWTDRTPGEKFEDFISFRNPAGQMIFVDLTTKPGFVTTSTNIGQIHNNATEGRDRPATITWAEYEQYVTWNYPGNATSLLARAGNGRYDGPEDWEESFSKKITPSDTTIGTIPPDIAGGHWLDQWIGYTSWEDWYGDLFGLGNTPAPAFPGAVQQANAYTPVNYVEGTTSQWIPNNTWGYDAPAEFCDVPSSMYHLGGDPLNALTLYGGDPNAWTTTVQGVWNNPSVNAVVMYGGDFALGEETSPWSTSNNGQDLWPPDPASPAGPDGLITSAGPFGFNNIGINGFDGADVLSLEVITRKVDGVGGVDDHPIQLRDTNLDGIWDSGNSRVGQAYYNAGGDGSGGYPFNRQRFMEDVVANWDHAENFVDLGVTTTDPGSTLYGFPIYPNATNAGWGALGGPAGAFDAILTRDSVDPIGITFQVRPMSGTLDEQNGNPGTNGVVFSDFGMAILCHEQGHDIQGWPDLYDYDVWSSTGGEIVNTPVAGYDLMSGGGLVHGIANMKATAAVGPWVTMKPIEPLVPVGVGPVTLDFYPTERFEDQYYQFTNPNNPAEFLDLWFNNNGTSYGVVGGAGLYITHQDFSAFGLADPIQQRINGHFTWEVVQADGLNQLQDAINFGDGGDPFPGTSNNHTFTADGNPPARWWNQSDMGMRILDVQLPSSAGQPARVTFERYNTSSPWPWTFNHADTDNDGIADAWEYHFFGDLTTVNATSDYDLDGLNDLNEYLAQLDPLHRFSADPTDMVDDSEYDSDGDLVSNGDEQNIHLTSPALPDTDDDGLSDGQEILAGLAPTNALSPLIDRVLNLPGSPTNYLRIPNGYNTSAGSMNLALETFAMDAWVYPRTVATPADLFVRTVNAASNYVNFRLALTTTRQLELSFTHVDGRTNAVLTAPAPTALPLGKWTHVQAAFDLGQQKMSIYVNGQLVAWSYTSLRPLTGGALTTSAVDCLVGRNFDGMMDEVRVWSANPGAKTVSELKNPLTGSEAGLLVYYRFDDGTNPNGVSGLPTWQLGEVQNFVSAFGRDWLTGWANAGSLAGSAAFMIAPSNAPVLAGSADTDGDGLPDYWEILHGLDPYSAAGADGALGDPDGDGLSNLSEYQLGYNPLDPDSDDDGVLDSLEDADGDGLPNNVEADTYGSRPDLVDTDDDGLSDGEEVMGIDNFGGFVTPAAPRRASSPIRSTDPIRMMSARFNGNGFMVVTNAAGHALQSWTIEAWVRPDAGADGVVVQRKVFNTIPAVSTNAINYELGVTPGPAGTVRPYVRYVGLATNGAPIEIRVNGLGLTEVVGGSQVTGLIPVDEWSHIAGAYDQDAHKLILFINGEQASYRLDAFAPWGLTGDVDAQVYDAYTTIGGGYGAGSVVENGFEGYIDDVAIAAGASDSATLARTLQTRSPVLNALTFAGAVPQSSSVRMTPLNEAVTLPAISNQIIVRLRSEYVGTAAVNALNGMGVNVLKSYQVVPVHLVEVPVGVTMSQKLAAIRSNPSVLYAEPNYRREFSKSPNDSSYAQMWGLNNTGQTGGTPDADIDAPEAWSRSTGSRNIIVAIIDSGCDRTHPDLSPNLWVNPGEIPNNGIDDDGNGYIDDVNGYDFYNGDADPDDIIGHGSHTAGTVGAAGNNALGVVGVNWNVQLMICKVGDYFLSDSAIIEAIQYAWRNGARVSNNSYGGYGYSQGIYDAINAASQAGHVFVAAAGNESNDNDGFQHYPSGYDLPNIISVAASDHNDLLADFSNYGATSVDLAAPGVGILSTVPGGYDVYDGTSMACPHVAGVAALILSANPGLGYAAVKASILAGADKVASMEGFTLTGARLNAANAVGGSGAYVALYSFNDGGVHAEDSTVVDGWKTGWATAGYFLNAGFSTNQWVQSTTDTDFDGMPDWWEAAAGLDPADSVGANGADGDADGDGLTNYDEYRAGTNPLLADTDGDGTLDGNEDSDADGLSNAQEQSQQTDPGRADTDDDGVLDGAEFTAHTSPISSLTPVNYRSLNLTGNQRLKVLHETSKDVVTDWTIEAWVNPASASQNSVILRRAERYALNGARWVDYQLGLSNGVPYVSYAFRIDSTQVVESVSARAALTTGQWTHLAAVRDVTNQQLRLYVDGKRVNMKFTTQQGPALVAGTFESVIGGGDLNGNTVSQGFNGKIDAVRVWGYVRTGLQIQQNRGTLLPQFTVAGLPDANRSPVRLFNFDDGGLHAENSYYANDWKQNWYHVAEAQPVGVTYTSLLASAAFPPVNLDSDDDCSTDLEELAAQYNVNRSEYPYLPRFLRFDGTGSVLVDEVVDATDTHLYALTNWSVEAWVRPHLLPTNRMPIVSRHTRDGDFRTFELGLINTNGILHAYAAFTRDEAGDHSEMFLTSNEPITIGTGSNAWTHLATVRSNGWFALFVNGEEAARSVDAAAVPEIGNSGYVVLGGTNFVGDLQEVRIWNKSRTALAIQTDMHRTLLFGASAAQNSFNAQAAYAGRPTTTNENPYHLDFTGIADYGNISVTEGHLVHRWTLEAWVKMAPGSQGGIVLERRTDRAANGIEPVWVVNHSLRVTADGHPLGYIQGFVTIYTAIIQSNQIVRIDRRTDDRERGVQSEMDIRDGQWHHLAFAGDGTSMALYIDGRLDLLDDRTHYYNLQILGNNVWEGIFHQWDTYGSVLRVGVDEAGASGGGNGDYFDGTIDEAMFWNEPMDAASIARHKDNGLSKSEISDGKLPIIPVPDNAIDDQLPHQYLASYLPFDGQLSMPYIPDLATSNKYIVLPQPTGAEIVTPSAPPIYVDPMRTYLLDLAGYFTGSDCGQTVENYMERGHFGHAGLRLGGVTFVSPNTSSSAPLEADSDGDTLPDWWETANGLDPTDASAEFGMWGDPDGDGLNNRGEYLAGTDPYNFDTSGNGFGDYYSTSSVSPNVGMMYGELYDDGDGISDAYEAQFPGILSPLTYDAYNDPDNDGWDNYSEFKAGTNPGNAASFPRPTIAATFNYSGTNVTTGNILVQTYTRAEMDGVPDAIVSVNPLALFPRTTNLGTFVAGHLHQGNNWLFAWVDNNNNDTFDVGEPASIAEAQPIGVQFAGPVAVTFNLTDNGLPGLQRFSWDPTGIGNAVTVRVTRTTSAGAPVVLVRSNLSQRSYFHEGDYILAGAAAKFGLDSGTETYKPGYAAYVTGGGTGVISRTFVFDWSQSLATPVAVSPVGAVIPFARNELVWTQDYSVTKNTIEIRAGSTNNVALYVGDQIPPVRDADGLYRMDFPFLFGDGVITNGSYYWRVISANPRQTSSASAWSQYTVSLQDSPAGAYTIGGSVYYYGKVTNGNIRIEAYSNPGFGDKPHARISLGANKGAYSLKGLRAGTYYVRAYIDQNNNKQLDSWESWGVVKSSALFDGFYTTKAITLPGNAPNESLVIVPHDSDEDNIPDDWEYANFGNLTKANGTTDADNDGLSDRMEYASTALDSNPNIADTDGDGILDGAEVLTYGTDPTKADSDGDGLNDGVEITYGSSPLVRDSDGDGVPDAIEFAKGASSTKADTDNDGYADALEIALGTSATNSASKPASQRLVNVIGITPGTTQDVIRFARVSTATNLQYGIQIVVESKDDVRAAWNDVAPSLRSLNVTNWASGPWSYTNDHGSNSVQFYDIKWAIP